ncbi:MAG: 3-oxoacid CoA-transferase subunit B [Deltaproteobacteria bacterium]|jgi:3-oxoacid CoA-transferase B subunit|nr:3-oxoacid CoA-transferase subunit B [Deltaproteobacteria bacterium]
MESKKIIAKNIALMLKDGDVVNLGVGIPTLVSQYIPEGVTVLLHGENGCLGQNTLISLPPEEMEAWESQNGGGDGDWSLGHRDLINASCEYITLIPGGCCFDSSVAFAMARGGHLDATILGALQVDAEGNLANWTIPGKRLTGMGGAMDLVNGAKKVIIAMEHCSKNNEFKVLTKCSMPLTAIQCVNVIVTELCILECKSGRLIVKAMAPGLKKEELESKTEAKLVFPDIIPEMEISDL